jgi:WD40 repeat protein
VGDALQRAVQASRAIKVINAHEGRVNDVTFSPKGDRLATAGEDETVKIWDVKTWKLLHTLRHDHEVWRVFFRPDGKQVLAVSGGQEARLWDPVTGQKHPLKHDEIVYAATYNPKGTLVATASQDGAVKVWDSATGAEVGAIPAQEKVAIYHVAFSPKDRYLATAGDDGVRIWDLKNILGKKSLDPPGAFKPRHRTRSEKIPVFLVFSPDGGRLASQGWDGSLEVYDLGSKKSWRAQGGNNAPPVFSPDGKQVALEKDFAILLYNSSTGEQESELVGHTDHVFQVAFLGSYLFSCSSDGTAKLWDKNTKNLVVTLRGHTNPISRFDFSSQSGLFATGGWDGTMRLWDCSFPHIDRITGFAFSPTGNLLATTSKDKTLKVWDVVANKVLYRIHDLKNSGSLAFDPGEKLLASKSDKIVYLWDAKTGEQRGRLENRGEVVNLAFSPNGRYLATGSNAPWGARIWKFDADMNLRSKEPLHSLSHPDATCVAFSPDSDILATGCADAKVRLWSVATGERLKEWKGHKRHVSSVAFSPKGCLASASLDQTVKVWDLTPKPELWDPTVSVWTKELFTIKKFNNRVDSVVFDRKGERLATVSRDLTARIFDARNGKELRTYHFPHVVDSVDFKPDNTELVIAGFHNELYYCPLDFEELLKQANDHAKQLNQGKN